MTGGWGADGIRLFPAGEWDAWPGLAQQDYPPRPAAAMRNAAGFIPAAPDVYRQRIPVLEWTDDASRRSDPSCVPATRAHQCANAVEVHRIGGEPRVDPVERWHVHDHRTRRVGEVDWLDPQRITAEPDPSWRGFYSRLGAMRFVPAQHPVDEPRCVQRDLHGNAI